MHHVDKNISGLGAGPGLTVEQAKNVEVMRNKRREHAQVIDARQREQLHRQAAARLRGPEAAPDSSHAGFREAGFFVPSMPGARDDDIDYAVHGARAGAHHALSAAVMDMEQDDNEALNAQRNAYHWDKRKKRCDSVGCQLLIYCVHTLFVTQVCQAAAGRGGPGRQASAQGHRRLYGQGGQGWWQGVAWSTVRQVGCAAQAVCGAWWQGGQQCWAGITGPARPVRGAEVHAT